ncbi:imidazole glycerol phosphate synthase subunit HisH [Kordiimonas lacus]|uniref:Imidazole glycerol phosphate synthase subunit HisH n=1 Tax=Kordiimonas lacus TaxID=637679 RepID=A0A1G6TBQ4_9PROT|nr:imidazole glycerol phosphate synthase subunit HisH [Kordiimonas lacus]SDD26562.1 glutamine amidotransferase [Kordiimonas lacus]
MKNPIISILDYGSGNIGSLVNMFNHIGTKVQVVSKAEKISSDAALVLPGVGHFGRAVEKLEKNGATEAILKHVDAGKPLLGICVGMQMLFEHSSEGDAPGLGLIKGKVRHFDRDRFSRRLPLPHVGWGSVGPVNAIGHRLLQNMPKHPRFYFVHSYHAECANQSDAIMEATYGYQFTCAVAHQNITGFQFHPEKSHVFGMALLSNWIKCINDQ